MSRNLQFIEIPPNEVFKTISKIPVMGAGIFSVALEVRDNGGAADLTLLGLTAADVIWAVDWGGDLAPEDAAASVLTIFHDIPSNVLIDILSLSLE